MQSNHTLNFHVLCCPVPVRSASASSEFLIWFLVHLPTNSADRISTMPSLLSLAYCKMDFFRSGTNSAATPAVFFGSAALPLAPAAVAVVVCAVVGVDFDAGDADVAAELGPTVATAAAPAPNAAKASVGTGGGAMALPGVLVKAAGVSAAGAGSLVSQYCVENGSIAPSWSGE